MNTIKRRQNEAEFEHWEELEGGGRKYWFDVVGKSGGFARYVKMVDSEETTLSFVQEVYDKQHILVEIHEKYPIDKGHKKVDP